MTEKIIPDGYKLVAVKGLDELVYWLERCKDKGHLENCADLIEPFEAFEYRNVSEEAVIAAHKAKAAPAVPEGWQVERRSDYRIRVRSPSGEAWSFEHVDDRGSSNLFVYQMLDAMLAATPATQSQPVTLTEDEIDVNTVWFDPDPHDNVHCDVHATVNKCIAALREKEGGV